jgi:hypothetical protein
MQAEIQISFTFRARDRELNGATQYPITSPMTFACTLAETNVPLERRRKVMKKIALIAALLVGSITSALAAPHTSAQNSAQDTYFDRTVDVGENGAGGN